MKFPPFDPAAHALSINRRTFLTQSAYGLGGLAFALLQSKLFAASNAAATTRPAGWNGALRVAHRPIKAKRLIYLCMAGGPSQPAGPQASSSVSWVASPTSP